eukprot:COSAG01_NODE_16533_length_1229_cov_1.069027_3_plen_120_part_01
MSLFCWLGGAVGGGAGQAGTNPTFNCYQTADNRWIQMLGLETARHWSLLVQCLGISHLVPEKWHTSVAKQRATAAETLQVGVRASEAPSGVLVSIPIFTSSAVTSSDTPRGVVGRKGVVS